MNKETKRILLGVAFCAVLATACARRNEATSLGRARSSSLATPAVHGGGETGKGKYAFEAQYWAMRNKASNFVPAPGSGPQPWQELMKQLARATTFEEYASCHTDDSLPVLEKVKSALLAQVLTSRRETDTATEQYYVTAIVKSEGREWLFIGWADEFIEPCEAGPPFAVLVLRKTGERYKIDLTQDGHPVFRALQSGCWKQFGAPEDIASDDRSPDSPSNGRAP